jgi:hypothetical protein
VPIRRKKVQKNFLYRNLANITSILGVLPLALLFFDDGYRYVIPLIIFNTHTSAAWS